MKINPYYGIMKKALSTQLFGKQSIQSLDYQSSVYDIDLMQLSPLSREK